MVLLGESEGEFLSDKLVVVSSDFKRTRETAEIIINTLKSSHPYILNMVSGKETLVS